MITKHISCLLAGISFIFLMTACNSGQVGNPSAMPVDLTPTLNIISPTETASAKIDPQIPSITSVEWNSTLQVIEVAIEPWPETWSEWTLILDGNEFRAEEDPASFVFRPNAPLDQSPTGLIIGALPWVSGLEEVDFPCCGTMQFNIPNLGTTYPFEYNLIDAGCKTASQKECKPEWTVHEGDMVLQGNEKKTIECEKILVKGNIYVKDSATLTLKDSQLMMERGDTPTIHMYIFVDPTATLIIDHTTIFPGPQSGGLACVMNRGTTNMIDSPTFIHYFDMSDGAVLNMDNSAMIFEIGGLLQVTGGKTNVTNSTIGALGLSVPAGAHLEVDGLQSGATFDHWKVQDLIAGADYELTLDNVTLLKDDFTGVYEHGPFERGWIFFLDRDSHVRLSKSELRKVFIDVRNDTVEFKDLKVGEPSDLIYRDIRLEDVIVQGQWPFTITNASVTIIDSNYLFLQPSGSSTINLINSHVVEFIPRNFTGTINFENGVWTNAGEILGGVDFHSQSNNFKITGSLEIGEELRTNLQWRDAHVTRAFDVVVTDSQGNPVAAAVIKMNGLEYVTDAGGTTKFDLIFDAANYNQVSVMEIWISGEMVRQTSIDFFTKTPISVTIPAR